MCSERTWLRLHLSQHSTAVGYNGDPTRLKPAPPTKLCVRCCISKQYQANANHRRGKGQDSRYLVLCLRNDDDDDDDDAFQPDPATMSFKCKANQLQHQPQLQVSTQIQLVDRNGHDSRLELPVRIDVRRIFWFGLEDFETFNRLHDFLRRPVSPRTKWSTTL